MRNLFLLLLFANLALYLWSYQKDNALDKRVITPPSNVPTLVLVSELSEELQAKYIAEDTIVEETEELLTSIVEVETEIIVPSDEFVATAALFDEQPIVDQDVSADLEIVPQHEEPVVNDSFCFKTKAIQYKNALSSVEKILLLSDLMVQREKTVVDVRVGYWVLIPPADDRNAAREMVEKLKEQGIIDVRRFTKGELVNAISLGLFRKKEYADRRSDIVKAKGFETKITPRMRSTDGYILHIESNDKAFSDQRLWSALSADKVHFQLQREPCSNK